MFSVADSLFCLIQRLRRWTMIEYKNLTSHAREGHVLCLNAKLRNKQGMRIIRWLESSSSRGIESRWQLESWVNTNREYESNVVQRRLQFSVEGIDPSSDPGLALRQFVICGMRELFFVLLWSNQAIGYHRGWRLVPPTLSLSCSCMRKEGRPRSNGETRKRQTKPLWRRLNLMTSLEHKDNLFRRVDPVSV